MIIAVMFTMMNPRMLLMWLCAFMFLFYESRVRMMVMFVVAL